LIQILKNIFLESSKKTIFFNSNLFQTNHKIIGVIYQNPNHFGQNSVIVGCGQRAELILMVGSRISHGVMAVIPGSLLAVM
jgi:hypothetical protein